MIRADESHRWVQCDQCQQWRNLPNCTPDEYESVQTLERWTCAMNTWNVSRASCSVPEEAFDNDCMAQKRTVMREHPRVQRGARVKRINARLPTSRPTRKTSEDSQLMRRELRTGRLVTAASRSDQYENRRGILSRHGSLELGLVDNRRQSTKNSRDCAVLDDEAMESDTSYGDGDSPQTPEAISRLRPRKVKESQEVYKKQKIQKRKKKIKKFEKVRNLMASSNNSEADKYVQQDSIKKENSTDDGPEGIDESINSNKRSCDTMDVPTAFSKRSKLHHEKSTSGDLISTHAKKELISLDSAEKNRVKDQTNDVATTETKQTIHWVQCDLCQKWRSLPGCSATEYEALTASDVPWTCSLNRWDILRASCRALEENSSTSKDSLTAAIKFDSAFELRIADLYELLLHQIQGRQKKIFNEAEKDSQISHVDGAEHQPRDKKTRQFVSSKESDAAAPTDVIGPNISDQRERKFRILKDSFPLIGFKWHELPSNLLNHMHLLTQMSNVPVLRRTKDVLEEWDIARLLIIKHFICNIPHLVDHVKQFAEISIRILRTITTDKPSASIHLKTPSSIVTLLLQLINLENCLDLQLPPYMSTNQTLEICRPKPMKDAPLKCENERLCDDIKPASNCPKTHHIGKDDQKIFLIHSLFVCLSKLKTSGITSDELSAFLKFVDLLAKVGQQVHENSTDVHQNLKNSESNVFGSANIQHGNQKLKDLHLLRSPYKAVEAVNSGLSQIFRSIRGAFSSHHLFLDSSPDSNFSSKISPPVTLFRTQPPVLSNHPLFSRAIIGCGQNIHQLVVTEVLPGVVTLHPSLPSSFTSKAQKSSGIAAPPTPSAMARSLQRGSCIVSSQPQSASKSGSRQSMEDSNSHPSTTMLASLLLSTCSPADQLSFHRDGPHLYRMGSAGRGSVVRNVSTTKQPGTSIPVTSHDHFHLDLPSRIPWPGTELQSDFSSISSSQSNSEDEELEWDKWEQLLINRNNSSELFRNRSLKRQRVLNKAEDLFDQMLCLTEDLIPSSNCWKADNFTDYVTEIPTTLDSQVIQKWTHFHDGDISVVGPNMIEVTTQQTNRPRIYREVTKRTERGTPRYTGGDSPLSSRQQFFPRPTTRQRGTSIVISNNNALSGNRHDAQRRTLANEATRNLDITKIPNSVISKLLMAGVKLPSHSHQQINWDINFGICLLNGKLFRLSRFHSLWKGDATGRRKDRHMAHLSSGATDKLVKAEKQLFKQFCKFHNPDEETSNLLANEMIQEVQQLASSPLSSPSLQAGHAKSSPRATFSPYHQSPNASCEDLKNGKGTEIINGWTDSLLYSTTLFDLCSPDLLVITLQFISSINSFLLLTSSALRFFELLLFHNEKEDPHNCCGDVEDSIAK